MGGVSVIRGRPTRVPQLSGASDLVLGAGGWRGRIPAPLPKEGGVPPWKCAPPGRACWVMCFLDLKIFNLFLLEKQEPESCWTQPEPPEPSDLPDPEPPDPPKPPVPSEPELPEPEPPLPQTVNPTGTLFPEVRLLPRCGHQNLQIIKCVQQLRPLLLLGEGPGARPPAPDCGKADLPGTHGFVMLMPGDK